MSRQQREFVGNLCSRDREHPHLSRKSDTSALIHRINRKGRTFYLVEKTGPRAAPYGLQFAHTKSEKIALFRNLLDVKTYIAKHDLALESQKISLDLNEVLDWTSGKKRTLPPLEALKDTWGLIVISGISQPLIRQKVNKIIAEQKNHNVLAVLGEAIELSKHTALSTKEHEEVRALLGAGLRQFDVVSEMT